MKIYGKKEFFRLTREKNGDIFLDDNEPVRKGITDTEARKVMLQMTQCENPAQFQAMERNVRNAYLAALKEEGVSIHRLCRLTGLSYGTVQKSGGRAAGDGRC